MDVELRHLRSFLAVAEELNFTKAAKRRFVAQQALSTHIRQLEERVGVQLLIRTTRSVQLTPAGETLYERARLLLEDADAAVAAARATATSSTTLVVGFVAAVDHVGVRSALGRFSAQRPDVDQVVRFGDLLDPTGGLRTHQADVAFVYGPFDRSGLTLRALYSEPLGIAMAEDHPLAAQAVVTIDDFVAQPTFDFPAPDHAWRDYWSASSHRVRPPRYVASYRTLEGLVTALRAGLGVHLATEGLVAATGGGVVWRPLEGVEPLQHAVAHRADDDNPLVVEFAAAVAETFTG